MTTAPEDRLPDGFHTRSLPDGRVEFSFTQAGDVLARGSCNADELSIIVANMLGAANSAFLMSDRALVAKQITTVNPIPASHWNIGSTQTKGQTVLSVQVGESVVSFLVPPDDIRKMARFFAHASWHMHSTKTVASLLTGMLGDFRADCVDFAATVRVRLAAWAQPKYEQTRLLISGRSLRVFHHVEFKRGMPTPQFPPANECIYCGALVYSEKPGIRRYPLGGEHIVPEGLGGKIEIPLASCQSCEEITGATVEGEVLGNTFKALRAHLKLRKPGGNPIPRNLTVTVQIDGKDTKKIIATEDYPIILMMLQFAQPGVFRGSVEQLPVAIGFQVAAIRWDQRMLIQKYGIFSFSSASWDNVMFCRMLAKIGHAAAIAVLGKSKFNPLLRALICDDDRSGIQYIGSEKIVRRAGAALHDLRIGYKRFGGKDYVVTHIRLFAEHGTPTYTVVVGESLESPIAKFMRVFSSRISSIARR